MCGVKMADKRLFIHPWWAEWGHENRNKSTYSARHNMMPGLSQQIRDHKETLQDETSVRGED